MKLKVFYNDSQSVAKNQSESPSAGKPALIAEIFAKFKEVELEHDFLPLTAKEIMLAHEPEFVEGVLNSTIANGFGNTSEEIAKSLLWTNGSFYAAARHAYENKTVTMSPTSGFHHAEWNHAEGFCTFNGLLVTALLLKQNQNVKRVAVVDFDAHYGNGLDHSCQRFGIDWITNYTFGAFADTLLRFGGHASFDSWLNVLENGKLQEIVQGHDIILYQAGADPHEDDPYGGYLTTEQMRKRDEIVFSVAKKLNIPIAWNLAGGYQTPVQKVLDLHVNTLKECIKIYGLE